MHKFYIGIDIGTSSIKLILVDNKLNMIYQKNYKYSYNILYDDWKEINPDYWYKIIIKGLKLMFKQINPQNIKGIGITGQMHTTVFLDNQGKSIRPAIMWNDMRTKNLVPIIKKQLQKNKKIAHIAKIVSTGSPLANLLWIKQNESENFERIAKILTPVNYIVYRLTNKYVANYCDASTSALFSLYDNSWSTEIQELFNIDPQIFPPIEPATKVVSELSEQLQTQLGINQSIKVVTGTGDNAASAIANQIFSDNQPLISLGTSGVLIVPNKNNELKEIGKNVILKMYSHDNSVMTQGTIQAGAKLNSWWIENIIHTKNYDKKQKEIPETLLGENKIIFFPHLGGEKTLYSNPNLRGAFVGLNLETTQQELYLAILEGLAFGIRTLFESMKNQEVPKYFSIIGGGAKSTLWLEIFANILGYPIKSFFSSREAVDGAAILAIIGDEEKIENSTRKYQMIYPNKGLISKYNDQYNKYTKLTQLILKFPHDIL